jgi:HTH-type transcriptional regulator/antitoxin HigA
MAADLKPIRTEADHEAALVEVERLWGAKSGTAEGQPAGRIGDFDRGV